MTKGWICIHRDIVKHWLWEDSDRLKWWLDLLFMALWEDKKVLHDTHLFTLKRGQLIASTSYLAKRWERDRKTILAYLKMLEEDKMIKRYTLHRQTAIITICNYESYQTSKDATMDTITDTITDTINDSYSIKHMDTITDTISGYKSGSYNNNNISPMDTITDIITDTITDTNKQYKQYNNNNIINNNNAREKNFTLEMKENSQWLELMSMRYKIQLNQLIKLIEEFELDIQCRGRKHSSFKEAIDHFNNWLIKKKDADNRKTDNKTAKEQRDEEFAAHIAKKLAGCRLS